METDLSQLPLMADKEPIETVVAEYDETDAPEYLAKMTVGLAHFFVFKLRSEHCSALSTYSPSSWRRCLLLALFPDRPAGEMRKGTDLYSKVRSDPPLYSHFVTTEFATSAPNTRKSCRPSESTT